MRMNCVSVFVRDRELDGCVLVEEVVIVTVHTALIGLDSWSKFVAFYS